METGQSTGVDSQYSTADSGSLPDSEQAEIPLGGDPLTKPVSSQAALLDVRVQELIGAINDKRKRDTALLADFKNDLEVNCMTVYSSMESTVYKTYNETNRVVEDKLQELLQVIERIGQLESELAEFKHAFSDLYSELQEPNRD